MQFLVVMTASIIPMPGIDGHRNDPVVRLSDYEAGLRFWLAQPHPNLRRILFLENTGADLSTLHAIAQDENPLAKEVEFVAMRRNEIPEKRHYGYGEMQMLDEGLALSRLKPLTTHMIKVTGRLQFPSVGKLMDRLPPEFDVLIECRIPLHAFKRARNPLRVIQQRTAAYATCQLMMFSHEFYARELQVLYHALAPGYPGSYPHLIENLIYDRVIQFEHSPGVYLRWPVNVEPVGYAGHGSKRYEDRGRRVLTACRAMARMVAPGFWL